MDKYYHAGGGKITHCNSVELTTIYYCDPSLPVGWIEGEEVYQVRRDGLSTFYKTDKHLFYKHFESDRRIWIEPKQEQPFQKEAEEFTKQKLRLVNSMLSDDYKIGYKEGVEHYLTSIAARQMSAGEVEELRRENERLKTVMIAAAEEIKLHWDAHCDEEGYGPTSLLYRLERGIPSQYGYTAGRFAELMKENEKLREQVRKLRKGLVNLLKETPKDETKWNLMSAIEWAEQLLKETE